MSVLLFAGCKQVDLIQCDNCYAITNTNIIDVAQGHADTAMTLVIQDNHILEVGNMAMMDIPKEIPTIDGRGKFVIPGLWDMHVHSSLDTITRTILFPLLIANGVTGIRNMKADCYDEEYPCAKYNDVSINMSKQWRTEITEGRLLGPRTILGSQMVNGPRNDSSTVLSPGTPEHGRAHVRFLKERGVDFIKVYEELPRDVYFAVAEEANKQHMVFAGHVTYTIKASEAAKAGQKSIEHCCEGNIMDECTTLEDELRKKWAAAVEKETYDLGKLILEMEATYDAGKCDRLFEEFVKYNTWFTPTLLVSESRYPYYFDWKTDKRLAYIPKSEQELWQKWNDEFDDVFGLWDETKQRTMRKRRFEIVRAMHQKGVPLLAGSDAGESGIFWGSSLHEELDLMVEAGLRAPEVLKTATLNPAIFLEATDSLGTISKGKLADIVVLDANPLLDIRNTRKINAVVVNGRYLDKAALDSILRHVALNVRSRFNPTPPWKQNPGANKNFQSSTPTTTY